MTVKKFFSGALLVTLGMSALASPGEGPSFNCKKAKAKVEIAICKSPLLSKADLELSLAYQDELGDANSGEPSPVIQEQRAWLKTRDQCSSEKLDACLKNSYRFRLRQLVFKQLREQSTPEITERANQRVEFLFKLSNDGKTKLTDSDLACQYLKEDPEHAEKDLRANFFSNLDNFFPICRNFFLPPAVQELTKHISKMQGNSSAECSGTMRFGYTRNEVLSLGMASLVPSIPKTVFPKKMVNRLRQQYSKGEESYFEEQVTPGLVYYPDLKHWSEQGIYERGMYKTYLSLAEKAEEALAHYHQKQSALSASEALKTAKAHLSLIEDAHLGNTGYSSTLSYPSLCYEVQDVEAFLKTGKVPEKPCPYQDFAEKSKGSVLRRLLGLAIIAGKSEAEIEKIIRAGADLQPNFDKKFELEQKESALMMAADRTEIIRLLIKSGALVNHKNLFGKTALMYAIQAKNLSGVKELLKAGADINALTIQEVECGLLAGNRSVLMYAAWHGTPEILDALLAVAPNRILPNRVLKDTDGKTAADYLTKNTELSAAALVKYKKELQSL